MTFSLVLEMMSTATRSTLRENLLGKASCSQCRCLHRRLIEIPERYVEDPRVAGW